LNFERDLSIKAWDPCERFFAREKKSAFLKNLGGLHPGSRAPLKITWNCFEWKGELVRYNPHGVPRKLQSGYKVAIWSLYKPVRNYHLPLAKDPPVYLL